MQKPFKVSHLLDFDEFVTPRIIEFVYWIVCLFAIIFLVIGAFAVPNAVTLIVAVVSAVFILLVIRIVFEINILFFKIYEVLKNIRDSKVQE